MRIKGAVASKWRERVRQLMEGREAIGESWRSISERRGINCATLTGWEWRLRREHATNAHPTALPSSFFELSFRVLRRTKEPISSWSCVEIGASLSVRNATR